MMAPMASPRANRGTPSQDMAGLPAILAPIATARLSVSSTSIKGSRVRIRMDVRPSPSGNESMEENELSS